MNNYQKLVEKWSPILEHASFAPITDKHKKAVTATILENTERALAETGDLSANMTSLLSESPTNDAGTGGFGGGSAAAGPTAGYDPILISLVRRAVPNMIAYDICGVQPMTGPTGLIFAMRARMGTQGGAEAFYGEADTSASGAGTHANTIPNANPALVTSGTGMDTGAAEALGEAGTPYGEMAFSIEKVTVSAKTRALKAEYTTELAQDLKAVHGLDAETELANILQTEILTEINREVVRTIYTTAKAGAQVNITTAGTFDLDTDSNGRWSVEKFKGLLFQLERDANAIGQLTRRGKGNIIICSADVASALQMSGVLDYAPALNTNLNVDDTGNTFAGVLNGKFKVYIDPYSANISASQFYVVGYKGTSPYDSGIFYCPYVPLQMVRAVGQDSFQPKIGFKTRYGMVANPFATTDGDGAIDLTSPAAGDQNVYYRRVKVANIM